MKTRILFDCRAVRNQPDGLGNYVYHLLFALSQIDAECEYYIIVSPTMMLRSSFETLFRCTNFHPIVTSVPFMGVQQQFLIPLLARRIPRLSLYHYPHFDMPIFCHSHSVVTIHDLNHIAFDRYFTSYHRVKRFYSLVMTTLTIAKAKHIITVSEHVKRELLRFFPWLNPDRVSVIYHGVNNVFRQALDNQDHLREFRLRFGLDAGQFILYVGTRRSNKNLPRLIKAFAKMYKHSAIPHRLLFIGSPGGDSGEVGRLIAELDLQRSVIDLGHIADSDLSLAYKVADVLVLCSLSEGFGMPLLEAMASGVPILCSNQGALAEVVGDSGLLVDPCSVDAIADGLYQVLSSEELRKELVKRGRQRVKNFTWEEAARKTLQVYAMVSGAGGR